MREGCLSDNSLTFLEIKSCKSLPVNVIVNLYFDIQITYLCIFVVFLEVANRLRG